MKKQIILITLLYLGLSQQICDPNQSLYDGQCVENSCIQDKLNRLKITTPRPDQVGQLQLGMMIGVVNQQTDYKIKIRYQDIEKKQLVSDPVNCLDFSIYQNKDHFKIDSSRLNLIDGIKSEWPQATYKYNNNIQCGEIIFDVKKSDLQNRHCGKQSDDTSITYDCYFELAFILKEQTIVSSYFQLELKQPLNESQNSTAQVFALGDLYKTEKQVNTDSVIQPKQTLSMDSLHATHEQSASSIDSKLTFCSDSNCAQESHQPNGQLHLNKQIYLKHSISNNDLSIDNPEVILDNGNFKFQLRGDELDVVKKQNGFSIYSFKVPLVSEGVRLSVNALASNGQTLLANIKLGEQKRSLNEDHLMEDKDFGEPKINVQSFTVRDSIHINDGASFVPPTHQIDEQFGQQEEAPILIQDYSHDRLHKVQREHIRDNVQSKKTQQTSFGGRQDDFKQTHQKAYEAHASPNKDLKCDTTNEFLYNGICLQKSCLFNKLQRVRMTPLHEYSDDAKSLEDHITYQILPSQTREGRIYKISLAYGDEENNQLVSEPEKCIDWRVYQTKNQHDIDSTRRNMPLDSLEGTKPSWPQPVYSYSNQMKAGHLTFELSHSELDDYDCLKFSSDGQVSYQCFFEFALVVQRITQISYYFKVSVVVDQNNDLQLLDMAMHYVTQ